MFEETYQFTSWESRHVQFFEWQELIWLHHFVSYECLRIMIWHGLSFEHFRNLDNWVFWTFWEMTCSFWSILSSDLGLNSFESFFSENGSQGNNFTWLSQMTCRFTWACDTMVSKSLHLLIFGQFCLELNYYS